ncbi:glyoxalase, partial [Streptomyces sp. NPDC059409]
GAPPAGGRAGAPPRPGAGAPAPRAPWDAPWGQRYAVVNDPDGHGVDLFAPLPE